MNWTEINAQSEQAEAAWPVGEGIEVLDSICGFLGRFIAYPSEHARTAHVLWIVHTHLMDAWDSTPRIAFLSPEPGSGKSRCLELTELLVPRPVCSISVTPAYIFRKVGDPAGKPTILFDEIDTVFGPRAKDNEEIRGLLNAGHRRGAVAGRCVVKGKEILTEELPAYCAVALAGLGSLPDTILTRSVIVRMRRRAPHEIVEPYRRKDHGADGQVIYDRLHAWAEIIEPQMIHARPVLPDGIVDRDADVWEALLAIAEAAGGDWPQRARVAAVTLVTASKEGTPSLGVRLLKDVRLAFDQQSALPTESLLARLNKMDEAPWGDLRGKPLDARALARLLKPYGVSPATIRTDGSTTMKGYRQSDLHDAWQRYLP